MATFGDLVVNLGLNANPFTRGLGMARGSLSGFASGLTGAGSKLLSFGSTIAGIGGGIGFGLMLKNSMESVDAIAKVADTMGMATEQVAALQHAANLAGVDNEALNSSLVIMAKNISNAADGAGPAADALKEIGVQASSLMTMSPEQQLGMLADGLNGVTNSTDRVRIATDLFGKSGAKMLPMLQGGSEGLSEMAEDAAKLGLTFSRIDAAKVEQANDAISRMHSAFTGVFNTLAIEFAPTITAVANHIAEFGSIAGEVARNFDSYWQMAANNFSIFFLESTAEIAGSFAGIFAASQVAFDKIIDYGTAKFAQLGALIQEQFLKLQGMGDSDLPVIMVQSAQKGFAATASVISGQLADDIDSAFQSESENVTSIFKDAAQSLRDRNDTLATNIAVAEQERLDALNLPGKTAAETSATGPAKSPEGLLKGSREALDKIANLRNQTRSSDPNVQTARNTQRAAAAAEKTAKAIESLAKGGQPVVVGAF